jgi:hypothetical protein
VLNKSGHDVLGELDVTLICCVDGRYQVGDTRHPPKICWVEIRRRRVDGRGMVSVDMRESAPLNEKNRQTGRKLRAI